MEIQRPIGFAPSEISARINTTVVWQHAEEAAFLWTLRAAAVREPHYLLKDLARLDGRVEAHLDGLRIAGDAGWHACVDNLLAQGPGDAFALSVAAFGTGNVERMRHALNAGCVTAAARRGLVSALAWLEYSVVERWIDRLLRARLAMHRRIGIAACACHRVDPGVALDEAVHDADITLSARALRAVGELKRTDLLEHVRRHLRDSKEETRFWAAWTLGMYREPQGLAELKRFVESGSSWAERAAQLAFRALPPDESRALLSAIAKTQSDRLAILAAGALGDPVTVPWLIRKMDNPDLARVAGESFSMITGADLAYLDLVQDSSLSADSENEQIEDVELPGYDSNLPWPSPELVLRWWTQQQPRFMPGVRYLAGHPINAASARQVLAVGNQRQRAGAAIEVSLIDESRPLFEIRERADRQRRRLESWTS